MMNFTMVSILSNHAKQGLSTLAALMLLCMSMLPSTASAQAGVLPLGSSMPLASGSVNLSDGTSKPFSSLQGSRATVIVFWSNKCPWCTKTESRLANLISSIDRTAVSVALVNSNDADAFPGESQAENAATAARLKVPVIGDNDGTLQKAFGASRAPHFFVFDKDGSLVYLGSLDDSPGDESNVKSTYVSDVLAALAKGGSISVTDTKAFGCLIKPKQ